MSNSKEKLEVIYLPYIHKWGKITNLAGLLLGFCRYCTWASSTAGGPRLVR